MKIRVFTVLFVILALLWGAGRTEAMASETEFVSKDFQMIYFTDGSNLQAECKDDVLIITGTHVKSNAGIAYDTTGFNITLDKTEGMVEYSYFLPVRLISKEEVITDVVTTRYILDRKSIFDGAFQIYLQKYEEIEKEAALRQFLQEMNENCGLDFYLHNVFRVIERSGGSGSSIIAASKPYNNLGTPPGSGRKIEGILNAVKDLYGCEWSKETQKKLAEYYDIHLKLYMEPCSTSVVLADEEGNILESILEDYLLVQYAEMLHTIPDKYMQIIEVNGGRYQLTEESIRKSYICYGTSKAKVQNYSLSDEEGLRVRLSAGRIEYRQLLPENSTVYLICEKVEDIGNVGTEEEIETEGKFLVDWFEPETEIKICAWNPEYSLFAAELQSGGIPVNEYLYLDCRLSRYLLRVEFEWKEGEVTLQIPVSRTYRLIWREQCGMDGTVPVYEEFSMDRTVLVYVPVKRKYRYVEIKNLDYFGLAELAVWNAVFPGGESKHNSSDKMFETLDMPVLYYQHYGGRNEHLIYPKEVTEGIQLETIVLRGEEAIPVIPEEDFKQIAEGLTEEFQVRNDNFCFQGLQYLADEFVYYQEKDSQSLQEIFGSLKKGNAGTSILSDKIMIPDSVLNGSYESSGELIYQRIESFQTVQPDTLVYPAERINRIYIHTPVYCAGILAADNRQYCQLAAPDEDMVQLIPDMEGISGDFTVEISNIGFHSQRKGYGERDYSRTLGDSGASYIARNEAGELRNEVCFPFDVFLDYGSNMDHSDDIFYPAGQWIVIGSRKVRFYLPEWVREGKYEVHFRTVAVNGTDYEFKEESYANTLRTNYTAVDTKWVQVSGKMYGFRIYDITDYPAWRVVFRSPEGWRLKYALENVRDGTSRKGFDLAAAYSYAAGTRDEYGRKTNRLEQFTIPLLEGVHPYLKKIFAKPGYVIRFQIETSGGLMQRDDSVIEIIPRFYHVDEDGKNRKEVDLYYSRRMADGKKYLVRIGSAADQSIQVSQTTGSKLLGIPCKELMATAALRGMELEDFLSQRNKMYSYSLIQSRINFKTFNNFDYCELMLNHKQADQIQKNGITEESLLALHQTCYFEYSLPYNLAAVPQNYPLETYAQQYGVDFSESFWIKSGYLILNFEITAKADGKAYLSYFNEKNQSNGYCNMWDTEGMFLKKTDGKGKSFLFHHGDIMIFPVNSSIQDDYLQGGIY